MFLMTPKACTIGHWKTSIMAGLIYIFLGAITLLLLRISFTLTKIKDRLYWANKIKEQQLNVFRETLEKICYNHEK